MQIAASKALIASLGLVALSCAPAKENNSSSNNLRTLSQSEKVAALKLQLSILHVQEAVFAVVDSHIQVGPNPAEINDLVTQIRAACEVSRLEVDTDNENDQRSSRRQERIEVSSSATKPECPVAVLMTRSLASRINGSVSRTEERGKVEVLVRDSANHQLLTRLRGANYTFTFTRTRAGQNEPSAAKYRHVSTGTLVRNNESKVRFTVSRTLQTSVSAAHSAATQLTKVSVKSDTLSSVWEQERSFIDTELQSESNKFNKESIEQRDFENIRFEANK